MTKAKPPAALGFEDVIARAELHEQLKNVPDVMLNHEQAAFFIGCHPKKLERWRTEKRPPFPVAMNAVGKSGVQVQYRVGTLLDFIRESQIQAPANNSATQLLTNKVVNGKRLKPDVMTWTAEDSIEVDELAEPFFMDDDGLVIAHGWDETASVIAERLTVQRTPIQWMAWDDALASVWQNESLRLSWLAFADTVAPLLRNIVEAKRVAALAKT